MLLDTGFCETPPEQTAAESDPNSVLAIFKEVANLRVGTSCGAGPDSSSRAPDRASGRRPSRLAWSASAEKNCALLS